MKYHKAALGGTFDRFHIGHVQLLKTALSIADDVVVGITTPELVLEKIHPELIEPYEVREQAIDDWLKENHLQNQTTEVVPLHDMYGPTLTDKSIDVLVVTNQTKLGGIIVNQERLRNGLPELPIVEAEMVKDEVGEYVSSTRIRTGEVSRNGRVYKKLFDQTITFTSESLQKLNSIQGQVIQSEDLIEKDLKNFVELVVIGDKVTLTFLEKNIPFTYALIDGKTKRNETVSFTYPIEKLLTSNPPGTIQKEVAQFLLNLPIKSIQNQIFYIDGEEDLLAFIPCLSLPINSAVFYGQPDKGIVMITLSESEKIRFAQFIDPSFK